MWEISEDGTKILFVPHYETSATKDLGSIVHLETIHKECYSQQRYLLKVPALFVLALFNDKQVFAYECCNHFAGTLEHALNVLRCMIK